MKKVSRFGDHVTVAKNAGCSAVAMNNGRVG